MLNEGYEEQTSDFFAFVPAACFFACFSSISPLQDGKEQSGIL